MAATTTEARRPKRREALFTKENKTVISAICSTKEIRCSILHIEKFHHINKLYILVNYTQLIYEHV
jgi:hypothetical protein